MTYSRFPSGPSPMTTRLSARRSTGGATPPPQQPVGDAKTDSHLDEEEITKPHMSASLKRTKESAKKVALENSYTLTESPRGGSAPPSTPKFSFTRISIKRPSSLTNGFAQQNDSMTESASSSDSNTAPSTPTPVSSSRKIKRIKIKMSTPPDHDDEDQDIKSSGLATPTPLSHPQIPQSLIKPASLSDNTVKGEDDAKVSRQPKELPDVPSTPPRTQSIPLSDAQVKSSNNKRNSETQEPSTPAQPPKKRGRKPKAALTVEVQELQSQEVTKATSDQSPKAVDADESIHLSPDPTGRRKRLAKKLVGAVNLETDLQYASPKQPATLERQIATAIIKGMSSQSLSSGRETRQSTARASTGRIQTGRQHEESTLTAEEPATPTPAAPKSSAKALGKRKAEEPPSEVIEPPKKRGRPAKKTAGTANAKAESRPTETALSQAAVQNERPKRGSRVTKAIEAQPQLLSEEPPHSSEPEPEPAQGHSVKKYNGVFSVSNQYANSWEESSFAGVVDPAAVNDPSFGTFTSPAPHTVCPPSSSKQAADLHWDIAAPPDHPAWTKCRCDICNRTMNNARSLRVGKHYYFSYATHVFPSESTDDTGAIPIAFGKVKDHRFLLCGSALPGVAPAQAQGQSAAPATGLPTITPSPGDEVFGLLYECPDRESVAKMAALAGRGDYDYRRSKVRVELQVHAAKRRPEMAGHQQPLKTVARVDAVVVRADPRRYHMPPQPANPVMAPEKRDSEDEEASNGGGRPRRRAGRPRRQQPKQQQEEPEEDEEAAATAAAFLKEGYMQEMNGAIAEAMLLGGGIPWSYVKGVIRKWIPASQERI